MCLFIHSACLLHVFYRPPIYSSHPSKWWKSCHLSRSPDCTQARQFKRFHPTKLCGSIAIRCYTILTNSLGYIWCWLGDTLLSLKLAPQGCTETHQAACFFIPWLPRQTHFWNQQFPHFPPIIYTQDISHAWSYPPVSCITISTDRIYGRDAGFCCRGSLEWGRARKAQSQPPKSQVGLRTVVALIEQQRTFQDLPKHTAAHSVDSPFCRQQEWYTMNILNQQNWWFPQQKWRI